jgi:hypothetical protein
MAMGAAKKGIGTGTKSSNLGKASTKPLLKNAAKRAKKSKFRRADTKSINGARAKALTARVDQMLWSANSNHRKVMSRKTLTSLLKVVLDGEELAWARSGFTTFGYGYGTTSATFALCARSGPNELGVAITRGPEARRRNMRCRMSESGTSRQMLPLNLMSALGSVAQVDTITQS